MGRARLGIPARRVLLRTGRDRTARRTRRDTGDDDLHRGHAGQCDTAAVLDDEGGALSGFAKGLAREWGPAGVTVNVVSPIAYSPAMTAAIEADPLMGKGFSRQIPLGRVGDPENEVGAGVAMLLGPHARYVTGQTLGIDGGQFTSQ